MFAFGCVERCVQDGDSAEFTNQLYKIAYFTRTYHQGEFFPIPPGTTYERIPYCTDITASLEKRVYYIFFARLTRRFFNSLDFRVAENKQFKSPRGVVRVARKKFVGTVIKNSIFCPSRGRKGIIYPFRVTLSRRSEIII